MKVKTDKKPHGVSFQNGRRFPTVKVKGNGGDILLPKAALRARGMKETHEVEFKSAIFSPSLLFRVL